MSDRYRKRPVEIDAMRFTGGNGAAAAIWCNGQHIQEPNGFDNAVAIDTLEGTMHAMPGDWIIRGIKGEFYPCKPDIFIATYEPVLMSAAPDLALGRCQAVIQCHRETGHQGGHEARTWLGLLGVTAEDGTKPMAEQRITVTLTDVDIDAATDALLAIEAWDERFHTLGSVEHARLGAIVLPLREARDRAITGGRDKA